MKHKHAELIKKWADGAKIQSKYSENYDWEDVNPSWGEQFEYRVKPEEKHMINQCSYKNQPKPERDLDAGATIDERWYITRKPKQEPVAWVCYGSSDSEMHDIDFEQEVVDALTVGTILYTTPPQSTWVGMTDIEIDELWMSHHDDFGNPLSETGYERAIEDKLKEKNT